MKSSIAKIVWNWNYERKLEKRRRVFYPPNETPSLPKRLLIVKLDSIGDYVLFRNFIEEIKKSSAYKDHRITLCGNQIWKDLSEFLDKDLVHEFIWVDLNAMANLEYELDMSKKIYDQAFDTAMSPTYSVCNNTYRLIIQSGAKHKIIQPGDKTNQLKRFNRKYLTRVIDVTNTLDFEFERNRSFFEQFLQMPLKDVKPYIPMTTTLSNQVIICPGAKFSFRQWQPAYFAEMVKYLHQLNHQTQFIVCGSKAEVHLAEAIRKELDPTIDTINACGKMTLVELANAIAAAKVTLCNDSGPYHLSVALNTPVICISNGNHYKRFCPYPKHYNKKTLEIFPEKFEETPWTENQLKDLQTKGSDIDINCITPKHVIERINALNFLNAYH